MRLTRTEVKHGGRGVERAFTFTVRLHELLDLVSRSPLL
jgi:hypothetical protein